MSDTGKCLTCGATVSLLRDGTLRRHPGATEFDLATDGICSGSYSLPDDGQTVTCSGCGCAHWAIQACPNPVCADNPRNASPERQAWIAQMKADAEAKAAEAARRQRLWGESFKK